MLVSAKQKGTRDQMLSIMKASRMPLALLAAATPSLALPQANVTTTGECLMLLSLCKANQACSYSYCFRLPFSPEQHSSPYRHRATQSLRGSRWLCRDNQGRMGLPPGRTQ